jgi:type II secretory ATPase GspE/PulE/Tfp pilus assembly ATPase PilB-like protein
MAIALLMGPVEVLLGQATVEVGNYINPWKLIPVVLLLFVWGKFVTWADKDAEVAHLPRVPVNLGLMVVGMLAFGLFFFLPFLVGTIALFVLVAGSIGGYIGLRASKVGTKDLAQQFKDGMASFGKKGGKKGAKEIISELQIVDSKGNLKSAPAEEDPQHAGYVAVQQLFVDPLRKNAERIQLVPTAEEGGYKLNYVVDGFTYSSANPDKAAAAAAVEFIKANAGLDLNEKRKPQKGKLKASTGGKRKEVEVVTSGSSIGEALDMVIDPKTRHAFRLEMLGMTELQEAAIRDSIDVKQGIVLLAAPKGQGLTSLCYGVIRAHDAFLNHIQTIERGADQDLEGITQNKLAANAPPAEELKQVKWVVSQEPDVIMMTSLEEPASAKEIIKHADAGRKAYVAVRANSALEAINVWRKWVGDDARAVRYLIMAVSGKVVRKLCPQCKVAITPDPDQLRKMNLDPQRVTQLFQERTEPMTDAKGNVILCDMCQELRFKGRTGVYEVIIVDDEVKQGILAGAGIKQLTTIIRKQRIPFLQESALELIQQGETSVKEVQRVFAEPKSSSSSSGKPVSA